MNGLEEASARPGRPGVTFDPLGDVRAVLHGVRRTPRAVYGIAVLPPVLVLVACGLQPWVPVADLLLDPMTVAYASGTGKSHFGLVSNLGVLLWAVAAAAGLVAAAVSLRFGERRRAFFFGMAAALGAALGADDMLLIHESVLGRHLGVDESVPFAAYGAWALVYGWAFRREISELHAGLLAVAFACFGASLLVDVSAAGAGPGPGGLALLVEDGGKFVGIACWTAFQVSAALRALRPAPEPWAAGGATPTALAAPR